MKQEKDIERLFRQHYEKMYNLAICISSLMTTRARMW